MSIEETARAATQYFPDYTEACLMTAICTAESGNEPTAQGDPATGPLANYSEWACDGYLSIGLGQIMMGVWHEPIRKLMEQPNATPCEMRNWLENPMNNMRMCRFVKDSQGWIAWSTYNVDSYVPHYHDAMTAVDATLGKTAHLAPGVQTIGIKRGQLRLVLETGEVLTFNLPIDKGITLEVDI